MLRFQFYSNESFSPTFTSPKASPDKLIYLANRARHEPKGYPRPKPAVLQNPSCAPKMEHVTAVQLKISQGR